jgi:hypothetical protein
LSTKIWAEEETLRHFKQNAELVFFPHNLLHQPAATAEQARQIGLSTILLLNNSPLRSVSTMFRERLAPVRQARGRPGSLRAVRSPGLIYRFGMKSS